MPRSGGSYALPSPPHPLTPNTLARAEDLNTVHTDIASALTGSVPVDGSAPMTGALTLSTSSPTAALHAASKGYVDAQISALQTGTLAVTNFVATNGTVQNFNVSGTMDLGGHNIGNVGTIVATTEQATNVIATFANFTNLLVGAGNLGFYGATGASKGTVTGSRGGNAALASLLAVLASYGLIVDSSSA